jgi:hypothetical protein
MLLDDEFWPLAALCGEDQPNKKNMLSATNKVAIAGC